MTSTMFYIFEFGDETIGYFFTTTEVFSSDFDSLQQLCEVGLDDPDCIPMDIHPRVDRHDDFSDCKFLFQTTNLETASLDFPEWFI